MANFNTDLIKAKLDIVEFLKGYLTLKPAGKNFKANCPFHNEKTPSFMISPDRQTWHCFGCSLGGDIFAFLMRYENLEFGEALKVLADKAGIELRNFNATDYKVAGLLYDLNEEAKKFYRKELNGSESAKKYLTSRGLTETTVDEFELGWAPNEPDTLGVYLLNKGFYPEDITRAGLSFKSERGLTLDRFRGRIMFPIMNTVGKVVGFTGRVLPELDDGRMGKYVNSPETPIFVKSKLLYGFYKSKNFIREASTVFLVEGQMDFLMSYQAGVKNAVASSGTALTVDHLTILRRLADQMVVSFDNDEAGLAAGERAIDLAEANDFNVRVLSLGNFKDPAEAIQNNPEAFRKSFSEARLAPEFYFERYLARFEGKPEGYRHPEFKKNLGIVLGKIRHIASAVLQSSWLRELSKRISVDEQALREEFSKLGTPQKSSPDIRERSAAEEPLTRQELLSQHLLGAALAKNAFDDIADSAEHFPPAYRAVFDILRKGERAAENSAHDQLINVISLRSGMYASEDIGELKKFLSEAYYKEKRQELTAALKRAEASGDEESIRLALSEFNKQLHYE